MTQIKLMKIDTSGHLIEMDTTADEVTLQSFTVNANGTFDATIGNLLIPLAIMAFPSSGSVYMDTPTQTVYGFDGAVYFPIGGTVVANDNEAFAMIQGVL